MSEGQIDPKLFRDNPDAVAAYLSDAFAKNDFPALLEAINFVMRAQNVQAMAREAGLRRDRLYKTFDGETNPMLGRVMALLNALGVHLTVTPLPPRAIPPRPKLGRPPKARSDLGMRIAPGAAQADVDGVRADVSLKAELQVAADATVARYGKASAAE